MTDDIYVTRPSLPPLNEFKEHLDRIWESGILSNCGPYHAELEAALCEYLKVPYISLFNNGTVALIAALKALDIEGGEVITTPFSFVATSHAISWTRSTPVFVDIDPVSLNLDPDLIEAAITDKTRAILPVHCYGHPADVVAIEAIAKRHSLPVIYDAAHAFGVHYEGSNVLNYGDLSVLSFHATKVFNTFEGGAIVCATAEMKDYIDKLKNFGHAGETQVVEIGINGKMSEINCAFGLLQLDHLEDALKKRGTIDQIYRTRLGKIRGITCLEKTGEEAANYSYFPVLIEPDFPMSRDDLFHYMKSHGVHPRRYFYPLIPEFPVYENLPSANLDKLPSAKDASRKIMCLPIYPDLDAVSLDRIISLIEAL